MLKDYSTIEKSMVKYRDLIDIPTKENGEPFFLLSPNGESVIGNYFKLYDMQSLFPQVPVRLSVSKKLEQANDNLKKKYPNLQLVVVYGYRSFEIQRKYFSEQKMKLKGKNLSLENLNEEIHRFVAVPSVAGHPTGGAVDVLIIDNETESFLDFGTEIFDFSSKDMYTLSPYIGKKAQINRQLLRNTLIEVGFAPFDGEWWHFSYGDKEWAFYYKQHHAIYEQKNASEVIQIL